MGVPLSSVNVQLHAPAQPESQSLPGLGAFVRRHQREHASELQPFRSPPDVMLALFNSRKVLGSFSQQSHHWVTEVRFLREILVVTKIAWLPCAAKSVCEFWNVAPLGSHGVGASEAGRLND